MHILMLLNLSQKRLMLILVQILKAGREGL